MGKLFLTALFLSGSIIGCSEYIAPTNSEQTGLAGSGTGDNSDLSEDAVAQQASGTSDAFVGSGTLPDKTGDSDGGAGDQPDEAGTDDGLEDGDGLGEDADGGEGDGANDGLTNTGGGTDSNEPPVNDPPTVTPIFHSSITDCQKLTQQYHRPQSVPGKIDLGAIGLSYAAMTIDKKGRWVVGGKSSDSEQVIARFLANGQLDPSFADDGVKKLPMANSNSFASLKTTSDGKIVGWSLFSVGNTTYETSFGTRSNLSHMLTEVVRLNENGSLDTEFATDPFDLSKFKTQEVAFKPQVPGIRVYDNMRPTSTVYDILYYTMTAGSLFVDNNDNIAMFHRTHTRLHWKNDFLLDSKGDHLQDGISGYLILFYHAGAVMDSQCRFINFGTYDNFDGSSGTNYHGFIARLSATSEGLRGDVDFPSFRLDTLKDRTVHGGFVGKDDRVGFITVENPATFTVNEVLQAGDSRGTHIQHTISLALSVSTRPWHYVIDNEGGIYLLFSGSANSHIIKLNPDFSLDTSFGNQGEIKLSTGFYHLILTAAGTLKGASLNAAGDIVFVDI